MAELAALGTIASAGIGLAGSLAGAAGQRVSGSLENTRKLLEAQEMRRKAVDVEGTADKTIANMKADADRVLSAQQAGAASQGWDTADTGITDLQGKVAAKATNAQLYERQKGIQQAADLILGAGQAEAAGEAAKRAASLQSMGTIIGGVGNATGSGFSDFLKSKGGTTSGWRRGASGAPGMPMDIKAPVYG